MPSHGKHLPVDERLRVEPTPLPGVLIVTPRVFEDDRGWFAEGFNRKTFLEAAGIDAAFVQDNDSTSGRGVLRGLHFQNPHAQSKLVRCVSGEIFDVVVDIRRSSPSFGDWFGVKLSQENGKQVWIPDHFAHGFLTLSDVALVMYKTTDYYRSGSDHTIVWDDPDIGIEWPLGGVSPILSPKDAAGARLVDAPVYR